jgi:L-ribulose-5-phosphate 4-epimerase
VTRALRAAEVAADYERHTGLVIVETFRRGRLAPAEVQAVLVRNHGPFTWGRTAAEAVLNAAVLEYLARMEVHALAMGFHHGLKRPAAYLVDKHYLRKHGASAYYGQAGKEKK